MRLLVAGIPSGYGVPIAGGPHYIRIGSIGDRESGFAPSHVAVPTSLLGIHRHAGTAHVPVVLHVAVEVVGNLLIHGDVIHLADGQGDTVKSTPVDGRDEHPTVIRNNEAVGIERIDPDVVGITSPADLVKTLARIQ